MKYIYGILISALKCLLWIIDADHRNHEEIAMDDVKKFTDVQSVDFTSDFGQVSKIFRTVPYRAWELKTTTKTLLAADRHRVIREDMSPVWLEDLVPGDRLMTDNGVEEVISCRDLGVRTHMYCVEVNSANPDDPYNHLFYTDGILSHNTTTAAAFLLWYAMFHEDKTVLIAANVYRQAQEIMYRIRTAYEECPDYIRAGCKAYAKGFIEFDNGSRIVSQATTNNTGRGMSISLLYCLDGDTDITIRRKATGEVIRISLIDFYEKLNAESQEL